MFEFSYLKNKKFSTNIILLHFFKNNIVTENNYIKTQISLKSMFSIFIFQIFQIQILSLAAFLITLSSHFSSFSHHYNTSFFLQTYLSYSSFARFLQIKQRLSHISF